MRFLQRGRVSVQCGGRDMRCAARPVRGMLSRLRTGEYVQDMLRLLLPADAAVSPGDLLTVESAPYVCVQVRLYPGHLQADVRRCSR